MKEYIIATDVSTDIPVEMAAEFDIKFVPMSYMIGDDEHMCYNLETADKLRIFYDAQREGKHTSTSQINQHNYMEYFSEFMKDGIDVIYLSLSSGLSNTYNSALMAKAELEEEYPDAKLYVVDSLAATGGMGLLMEGCALNRKAGMSAEDNFNWMVEHSKKLCHWFMVEDLMHLKRGGRISAATAVVGTALNIKPILEINAEGKLITVNKKRGVKLAIQYMLEQYFSTRDAEEGNTVYITHADAPEAAESLKAAILERDPGVNVRMTYLSPIIGSHVGPGMFSCIHYGEKI